MEGTSRMVNTVEYRVRRRDNLSNIVRRLGFPARDWRRIYEASYNRRFRRQHPDPNLIQPGSVLNVPRWSPQQIRDLMRKIDNARTTVAQGDRVLAALQRNADRVGDLIENSNGRDRKLRDRVAEIRRDADHARDIAAHAGDVCADANGEGWECLGAAAAAARFEATAARLDREADTLERTHHSDTPKLERNLANLRRSIREVQRGHSETQRRLDALRTELRRAQSNPYR